MLSAIHVGAQEVGLKTNLLYWSTGTPNVGAEIGLGRRTTGQVFFGLNPWRGRGDRHPSLRHWVVQPELRHWFCQKFNGWFVGIHAMGGQYNAGGVDLPFNLIHTLKDHRYKGWYIGGGLTGGYQWPVSRHFSIEADLGVGYLYSPYTKYCAYCKNISSRGHRNYVGPTKAAVSVIYVFNSKRKPASNGQGEAVLTPSTQTAIVVPKANDSRTARVSKAKDSRTIRIANNQVVVDDIKVIPTADLLTLTMLLRLASLRLRTNNQLVYTPIVKTSHGEVAMPKFVINGRRQQVLYERGMSADRFGSNATVVRRLNGKPQTVKYTATVPVDKKFDNYDLRLNEDLCGCGDLDSASANHYPLISWHQPKASFILPKAEAVKIRHLDKRAYIDFPVNRIELYPDYRRNPAQLDSIIQTINNLKNDENLEVSSINIHGYASPESPYSHNDYLARNRAKTLTDFVQRMVNLPKSIFTVSSTPEDWDGLRAYLKESNLEHKDEILAIANNENIDPDAREWQIKLKYPDEYKFMLTTWYPALRHSDYHITYTVKPFDVEKAKQLIKTHPQLLSEEEMFMVAQTYEPGSKEFNDVMQTAVRLFPNNISANLNAAIALLNEGKADEAKSYLDKVGDIPEAEEARKVYEALQQ